MTSKDKEKQIRMTLQDCLINQGRLRELLQTLIRENRPLSFNEKKDFYLLLPKALLSQGSTDPAYLVINNGWFIFSSVQNLGHRLADIYANKVFLKTTRPENVEITVEIKELWQFLYDKILYLFPQANAEAIHISAESVERPQQGAYSFTSKEALKNDR